MAIERILTYYLGTVLAASPLPSSNAVLPDDASSSLAPRSSYCIESRVDNQDHTFYRKAHNTLISHDSKLPIGIGMLVLGVWLGAFSWKVWKISADDEDTA